MYITVVYGDIDNIFGKFPASCIFRWKEESKNILGTAFLYFGFRGLESEKGIFIREEKLSMN